MIHIHKSYFILSFAEVTKKLSPQFVGPFQIQERVGCLAYRLDISNDWKIYPVFSLAQLEPTPTPAHNFFNRPRLHMPLAVFVNGDIHTLQCFKVNRLLNKKTKRKSRGQAVEYLVCQTGYNLKWNMQYNVKNLENTAKLYKKKV